MAGAHVRLPQDTNMGLFLGLFLLWLICLLLDISYLLDDAVLVCTYGGFHHPLTIKKVYPRGIIIAVVCLLITFAFPRCAFTSFSVWDTAVVLKIPHTKERWMDTNLKLVPIWWDFAPQSDPFGLHIIMKCRDTLFPWLWDSLNLKHIENKEEPQQPNALEMIVCPNESNECIETLI